MIDVSDGLSSDLRHLCESSKVGAEIDASRLPIDRDVVAQFPPEEALYLALNGGEDFELLFTADVSEMERSGPGGVTLIGRVTRDVGNIVLIDGSSRSSLPSRGFEHFTRS